MSNPVDNRLRVLFVTTSFPRYIDDYAGSFVYRFALYLQNDFCDLTVIAPDDRNSKFEDDFKGIKVKRFQYFIKKYQYVAYGNGGILANLRTNFLAVLQLPLFLISMTFKVMREINNSDIVHCHWLPVVFPVAIAKLLTFNSNPVVLTNWGSDTRLLPLWIQRIALRLVDGCISTAVETDQHLLRLNYTKFIHVPGPIDEEKFSKTTDIVAYKDKLGINAEVPVISFIGRLNYFKDPITFIRACKILSNLNSNFVALIAGGGDLEEECRHEIELNKLETHVKLLGFRKDTESILSISDIFVHISPVENTWATVIAEAMYCKVPVIMTDVGPTKSTFTHLENCYLVPAVDTTSLANSLKYLLASSELCSKLETGGWKLLQKHGKIGNTSAEETYKYYIGLINKHE